MKNGSIPIGKVFGIPLRLHFSWFFIFAIVIWALTASYSEEWGMAISIITATITSLLFFSSVTLHELMHSIVAKKSGIPVDSITLFLFGGVSRITREPSNPKMELKIALAGPLTSLLLGVAFWLIRYIVPASWEHIIVVTFWLGLINLSLGVFNMLPGFPLDGGRVLRAILWWRTNNLKKATRWASRAGQGLSFLMIAGGVWLVFAGFWENGLWLAFIGWFLGNAAAGSYRQLTLQQTLQGHKVSEAMTKGCLAVPQQLTLEKLVSEYILLYGNQCFTVKDGDSIKGVITVEDVKKIKRELWAEKRVEEAMTPLDKMRKVRPDDALIGVFDMMIQQNINELPVVEGGNIVGMIRRENLLSFINLRDKMGV